MNSSKKLNVECLQQVARRSIHVKFYLYLFGKNVIQKKKSWHRKSMLCVWWHHFTPYEDSQSYSAQAHSRKFNQICARCPRRFKKVGKIVVNFISSQFQLSCTSRAPYLGSCLFSHPSFFNKNQIISLNLISPYGETEMRHSAKLARLGFSFFSFIQQWNQN